MNEKDSIPRQLAYVTIRIECKRINGESSYGTGFFFLFKYTGKSFYPAIITNRHVLEDFSQIILYFTQKNTNSEPEIGKIIPCIIPNAKKFLIFHPDPDVDLVAFLIGEYLHQAEEMGSPLYYVAIDASIIPSADRLAKLSALEEIVMIGYPIGIWDNVNNMPIFRKGITATHPCYNYQGRKEFVIDAACFPGSSGSPVFRYKEGLNIFSKTTKVAGREPQLEFLGVLYAGPQLTIEGIIKTVNVPTKQVPLSVSKIPTNLGYVIKAERLLEIEPLIVEVFGK